MTKKPHRETANNTSVIVKEQLQLVKVEAELKKAIENINEYINTLCVEEMELKSALANQIPNAQPIKFTAKSDFEQLDAANVINKQLLNLNQIGNSNSMNEEEEEEDDD